MSKARVVVLEIVSRHLSVTAAARTYGLSRQHIYRLLARYRAGGLESLEPRSRRPASNPRATSDEVITAVVLLREELVAQGLDAGPITIQTHLARRGLPIPSTATIRRILHHHGLITPKHASAPAAPITASPPNSPTNAGNRTSLTGPWPMAPTPRSSTGSTTTPATCCRAPPTAASAAPMSWRPLPPPPSNSGSRQPP